MSASSTDANPLPTPNGAPTLPKSAPTRAPTDDLGATWINLVWLVKLRWWAITGQLVTIAAAQLWMGFALPIIPIFLLLGTQAASNAAVSAWLPRKPLVRPWMLVALMATDILTLSGLLYLTGGPFNPFSVMFLVNIALAAAVLPSRWTWALVALSMSCFAALFWRSLALQMGAHGAHGAHGAPTDHMGMHLQGMWIAFGVAACFISYFVTRVRVALTARERDLILSREATARAERLASLATLAAGAAHELSSPLSTIAIASKELELVLRDRLQVEPELVEDLQLIRTEVHRCRDILDRMAAEAGASAGASLVTITARDLITQAGEGLPIQGRLHLDPNASALDQPVEVPGGAVIRALRALLKNALDASPPGAPITLEVNTLRDGLSLRIHDQGEGMSPQTLARIGEPFFTTKEAGHGMGLGVFLAQAVFARIGGHLDFSSSPQHGTTASLTLPLRAAFTAPAAAPL